MNVNVENEEVVFACNICSHDFDIADDYNSHMKTHHKEVTKDEPETEIENRIYCYITEYFINNPEVSKEALEIETKFLAGTM